MDFFVCYLGKVHVRRLECILKAGKRPSISVHGGFGLFCCRQICVFLAGTNRWGKQRNPHLPLKKMPAEAYWEMPPLTDNIARLLDVKLQKICQSKKNRGKVLVLIKRVPPAGRRVRWVRDSKQDYKDLRKTIMKLIKKWNHYVENQV